MRIAAATIFLSLTFGTTTPLMAQAYRVGVDPRIELISVVFRLAGNDEYNQCKIPAYDRALEQHFGQYRNHEAVQLARSLSTGFESPMNLAVHISDVQTLAERIPLDKQGTHLNEPWKGAEGRKFLAALRKFVADTNFNEFLKSQQKLYDETNTRLREFVESRADLVWYNRFFGTRSPVRFIVVPGMADGGPSYGTSFGGDDGVEEVYAIPGVWEVDKDGLPQFGTDWRDMMVHEFVHSFSNPVVDKFASQMEAAAAQINDQVKTEMRRQAYGDWKTLLYESLVRVTTIHYVLEHDGAKAAQRLIQEDNSRSFFWISELSDKVTVYETHRQEFPTLESFMPQIVAFFNGLPPRMGELEKRYDESRPRVGSSTITDGANDVDPALKELKVKFSRAMNRSAER